jgi:hypothetical protein
MIGVYFISLFQQFGILAVDGRIGNRNSGFVNTVYGGLRAEGTSPKVPWPFLRCEKPIYILPNLIEGRVDMVLGAAMISIPFPISRNEFSERILFINHKYLYLRAEF